MNNDVGSSQDVALKEALNTLSATTNASVSFNHNAADSVRYVIYVSDVNTTGTLTVKLQYSTDDFSTDTTDEPDTTLGNDTTTTITAAGLTFIDVPNPRAQYTRVFCTAAIAAIDYCVISIGSPRAYTAA